MFQRLTAPFLDAYRRADRTGKIFLALAPLLFTCCICSLFSAALAPDDDAAEPTVMADVLPTVEEVIEETDRVQPVELDEPTQPAAAAITEPETESVISAATNTPRPQPTNTRRPTRVATAEPTAPPQPANTQPPQPTVTTAATITPANTLPPAPTPTMVTAVPTTAATVAPTLVATATTATGEELATVTAVIDGDTIEVNMGGNIVRVRYIGINTAESNEPCGSEATQANAALVAGQTVRMVKDVSETDQFGRLLRYVYVGNTFVNGELVRQGWAEAVRYPPDIAQAVHLESLAVNAPVPSCQIAQATAPPPPPPPSAAGDVVISFIFYDGVEPQVEGDEYATITNNGGTAVNLSGWRLNAGNPGQDFTFPSFDLQPGQSCRVYTDEVHPEYCGFSFGSGQPVWNNGGDCGYLFDNTGTQVSQRCY